MFVRLGRHWGGQRFVNDAVLNSFDLSGYWRKEDGSKVKVKPMLPPFDYQEFFSSRFQNPPPSHETPLPLQKQPSSSAPTPTKTRLGVPTS